MSRARHARCAAGFTLLPVILAMSLIAAIAFLLNRDNGITVNLAAGQADKERARYAAEAGLQAVNFTIQGLGCGGGYPVAAAPVTDNNFGSATYTAYSDRSVGSPMTLTSTGTYNGASVTLTRATYAYQGARKTWGAQPDDTRGKDTYLDASNATRNFGASTPLKIQSARFEALLQFDLSPLPAGSRVIPWYDNATAALQPGAKLSVYKTPASPAAADSIAALLITRSWVAGTKTGGGGAADGATWNTYDGSGNWPSPGVGYDARAIATVPYQVAVGWQDFDVTDAVAAWLSGVYPNYGVWLRAVGGNVNNARYYASDETGANNVLLRPKLVASYLLPCGAVAPPWGITQTFNPIMDTRLDSAAATTNYGARNTVVVEGSPNENRAILAFDTSSILPGTVIVSAILRMRVTATAGATGNPKVITAHALTQAWVEGTNAAGSGATWNSRTGVINWTASGGSYTAAVVSGATEEASGLSPPPASFRTGWLTWNLTTLTQEWVDGITANNGTILISAVTDSMTLNSAEAGAANRPQLVVSY